MLTSDNQICFHYAKQLSNRKEFLNIRVNHFKFVHVCQFTTIYELVYYVCTLSIYFKMSNPILIKNGSKSFIYIYPRKASGVLYCPGLNIIIPF